MSTEEVRNEELTQCSEILKELQSKPEAEPFQEPVDWRGLNLHDYPQIIKNPMDLRTITSKLQSNKYNDAYEFAEDVRLVWRNAKRYNTPGSGIYMVAENLAKIFERKFARIKKASTSRRKHADKVKGKESTHADRVKFTELIKKINSDQLGKVVEMIDKKCPASLNSLENEEDIEIEVYHIDADTLQELIDYCTKCINKGREKSNTTSNANTTATTAAATTTTSTTNTSIPPMESIITPIGDAPVDTIPTDIPIMEHTTPNQNTEPIESNDNTKNESMDHNIIDSNFNHSNNSSTSTENSQPPSNDHDNSVTMVDVNDPEKKAS